VTRRLLVVVSCVLLVASCANIPEQTSPQVIQSSAAPPRQPVQLPTKDVDAITIVREFIDEASTDTGVAQAYLTEAARRAWRPEIQPTIIENDFSTLPQPIEEEGDPNETVVEVKGTKVGRLDPNKSFVSEVGAHNQTIKLTRQQDGQWRISELPGGSGLTIPIDAFNDKYRPVKLYFYDSTKTLLVPDLRYLPGAPLASPTDIVTLLVGGAATSLQGAVKSALPPATIQRNNVTAAKDTGAMVVNFGGLGNLTAEDKYLVAQQVVLSLQDVAASVRLQVEGLPLNQDKQDWKVSDILSVSDRTTPNASLAGMMVVGNKLRDLRDGKQLNNGASELRVESAAQSIDGSQLAVVERMGNGALQLRVGPADQGLRPSITGSEMTRPTWQFAVSSDQIGNEVWTVSDGQVIRIVRNKDGVTWAALPVNAAELQSHGKITELRLSRDGVRVAVVAGGKLYVGAVSRNETAVTISAPKALLPKVDSVVSVDWLEPSTLVVATNVPNALVWRVPVDGVDARPYTATNLTAPLTSVTAAPSRQVVVTDSVGMWTTSDPGQIWRPHPQNQGAAARPFYPG
jgi:hypothetical protein